MHPTIPQTPARSLHAILDDTSRATCPVCPALPGDECVFTTAPLAMPVIPGTRMSPARGCHVGRLAVAETNGLISAADFDVAVVTAGAFSISTLIYDSEGTAMNETTRPLGPFKTEREARAAAHTAIRPADGLSVLSAAQNRQLLGRALEAAGVSTGRYDDRIIEWLAGWEDSTVAVVAGWVQRAAAARPAVLSGTDLATIAAALEDAAASRRERVAAYCHDCVSNPAGARDDHLNDLDRAGEYDVLAARIALASPSCTGRPDCQCGHGYHQDDLPRKDGQL
jgi:hypothetical protein